MKKEIKEENIFFTKLELSIVSVHFVTHIPIFNFVEKVKLRTLKYFEFSIITYFIYKVYIIQLFIKKKNDKKRYKKYIFFLGKKIK